MPQAEPSLGRKLPRFYPGGDVWVKVPGVHTPVWSRGTSEQHTAASSGKGCLGMAKSKEESEGRVVSCSALFFTLVFLFLSRRVGCFLNLLLH